MTVPEYLHEIQKSIAHGDATEHTHRPALKALLESLSKGITATNEPKRIACGAPDFIISRKRVPLGHVETKDVGTNLNEIERGRGPHGEQFKRYIEALPNWVLTDYLEFRWYVAGEKRLTARLADQDSKNKIHIYPAGGAEVSSLLEAFIGQPALTVDNAKDLARRLAGMTRVVRDLIAATFQHGSTTDRKWLDNWIASFREVLIPDLDENQFADMFAQTLAYGLFAARVHSLGSGQRFSREMAAFSLPRTNPFLRKLFAEIAGVDMPDTFDWAVDDIVLLLNHTEWGNVLEGFGKGKGKHDPVIHFYETFLAAYDPELREVRGVYYTPESVVSYIVHSIDHLLQTQFEKPKGLADEKTLILDPAAGTGTFLFFVIQQIHSRFARQEGAWDAYVSQHLLNRVFGFELLMAPYAVAHLKLGMELKDTGYKFNSDQRLGIYLTNTLEEAARKSQKLIAEWISEEANAAAEIKREKPILVILGNPPYSGHSANRSEITVQVQRFLKNGRQKTVRKKQKTWIGRLMETYKEGCPELRKPAQAKWLQNDYVKFIRFAQWRIGETEEGIIGYITDRGYLENPTFRRMRQSLMESFQDIYVYDLHGSSKKREEAPGGLKDKNVFDIQQGVAILLCVKERNNKNLARVHRADLWGPRQFKYDTLSESDVSSTRWNDLSPGKPDYLFAPENKSLRAEYDLGWSIADIFNQNGDPAPGIVTTHDEFAIAFSQEEMVAKVHALLSAKDETEARSKFRLCKQSQWIYADAVRELGSAEWREQLVPILYRPFDLRWTVYNRYVAVHRRDRVMKHMLGKTPNLALATVQYVEIGSGYEHAMCTRNLIQHHTVSMKEVNYLFPLFLRDELLGQVSTRLNLGADFLKEIAVKLRLRQNDPDGLPDGVSAETIFAYIYAVLHSPGYRKRYSAFTKLGFPRVPLTADPSVFAALAARGTELVALHLMESSGLDDLITDFPEKGDNLVSKVVRTEESRVWINERQFFGEVPRMAWDFQIGGYQVCERWLQDREGRKLSYDEIRHYQRMIVALVKTVRIMTEIDEIVTSWPVK